MARLELLQNGKQQQEHSKIIYCEPASYNICTPEMKLRYSAVAMQQITSF